MSRQTTIFVAVLAVWALFTGCGGTDTDDRESSITGVALTLEMLPTVGESYQWEAWIETGDGPVSVGAFEQGKESPDYDFSGDLYDFSIDSSLAEKAQGFLLTLESKPDDNEAPSGWNLLASDQLPKSGRTTARFTTAPAIGAELDGDMDQATGSYVLDTPSSSAEDDNTQGIWFIDTSNGERKAGLDLPKLPEDSAWVYEGWIVGGDGPISTGQFRDPTAPDHDGAGPDAGDSQGYAFPGQDFVKDGGKMLASGDYETFVTLEPDDGVAAPFAFRPLAADIPADIGADNVQPVESTIDSPPTVFVSFFGDYEPAH